MSCSACFLWLPIDKCNEFLKLPGFLPSKESTKSLKNSSAESSEILDFISKSKCLIYKWSPDVILVLMRCLKESEGIDLMVNHKSYEPTPGDKIGIWIFDKQMKDSYLDRLEPSRFSESNLKLEFAHHAELRSSQSEQLWPEYERSGYADFPKAGKCMMDGIRMIHESLKLVDDKSVVLLGIG